MKPRTDVFTAGVDEQVAMLVRFLPVRLVEVSRGGCRLECSSHLGDGISGQLAVELDGLMRVDDVRVARCQRRMGAGPVFQIGAELLRLRRLGRRTIRMAIRTIISGERETGRACRTEDLSAPRQLRTSGVADRTDSRAPPVRL